MKNNNNNNNNNKKNNKKKNTCYKHSRPLPYYMPKQLGAPALEATQHHRPTQPPTFMLVLCVVIYILSAFIYQ